MNSVWRGILALLVATAAVSCSHKDIDCPGGAMHGITVLFDWVKAPGASPAGMTLFFYPLWQDGKIWRYEIAGPDGGGVELPSGRYRLVAFNNDLPPITLSGTGSYSTLVASVRDVSADGVFPSAGMLYGGTIDELEVTPCGVEYRSSDGAPVKHCGKGVVRCHPDSLATEYHVAINKVKKREQLRSVAARVKGVSPGVYPASDTPAGVVGALSLRLDRRNIGEGFVGHGCAFAASGVLPSGLDVVITRADGKSFVRSYGQSELEINHMGRHSVLLEIDSMEIPDGDTPGGDVGGIDAVVDGWNAMEVDINVPIPLSAGM